MNEVKEFKYRIRTGYKPKSSTYITSRSFIYLLQEKRKNIFGKTKWVTIESYFELGDLELAYIHLTKPDKYLK